MSSNTTAVQLAPEEIEALRSSGFFLAEIEDPAVYAPPRGGLVVVRDTEDPGSEIVGIAGFRELAPGVAELEPFKVSMYHRGRGIGGKLMRAVLAGAKAAGYERIESRLMLWCPDYQAFYRANGFTFVHGDGQNAEGVMERVL